MKYRVNGKYRYRDCVCRYAPARLIYINERLRSLNTNRKKIHILRIVLFGLIFKNNFARDVILKNFHTHVMFTKVLVVYRNVNTVRKRCLIKNTNCTQKKRRKHRAFETTSMTMAYWSAIKVKYRTSPRVCVCG